MRVRGRPSAASAASAASASGHSAAALRDAFEEALRDAQALRWQRNLAQAELDRLRRQLREAEEGREQQGQRREALIEAVAASVPSAMLTAGRQGWDEGWEAAQVGFPKSMNPHRDCSGPVGDQIRR